MCPSGAVLQCHVCPIMHWELGVQDVQDKQAEHIQINMLLVKFDLLFSVVQF